MGEVCELAPYCRLSLGRKRTLASQRGSLRIEAVRGVLFTRSSEPHGRIDATEGLTPPARLAASERRRPGGVDSWRVRSNDPERKRPQMRRETKWERSKPRSRKASKGAHVLEEMVGVFGRLIESMMLPAREQVRISPTLVRRGDRLINPLKCAP